MFIVTNTKAYLRPSPKLWSYVSLALTGCCDNKRRTWIISQLYLYNYEFTDDISSSSVNMHDN